MLELGKIQKKVLMLTTALGLLCAARVQAMEMSHFSNVFDPGLELPNKNSRQLQHARADKWRISGRTLFVDGNVYIPYGNVIVRADSAMIDLESRDIEAKGNITFVAVKKVKQTFTVDELERLIQKPGVVTEIVGSTLTPLGDRKLEVIVSQQSSGVTASRMSGNLLTGNMTFTDIQLQVKHFTCKAKRGIRQPGGEIKLESAEISSCEYLREDQSHISFTMSSANIYPHEGGTFGFEGMESDYTEYSMWGYNGALRLYGIPLLWLPMIYTPKDESPGLFQMQFGKSGDWGYYGLFSKKYQLFEYPYVTMVLDLDWYTLRGLGYGQHSSINTENSRTELVAYGIYDIRPYESSGQKPDHAGNARLDIPNWRFDLRMTHMTHLTPRLDFRGQIEWLSDAYMLDDYFPARANTLSEPASYAALEYQGDRFSASVYTRVRINDFYNTVQKLPELRLDLPRQEVIPGSGLYYQGSHTADYLHMNWASFDRKLRNPDSKLKNYGTGRFDSVNFLYYPLRNDYINIVPRAGLRMTGYTHTSKTRITEKDIYAMEVASDIEDDYAVAVKNYDEDGGADFRLVAEFGVEANTKIYQSWQNIRNHTLGLDGLRHIFEPYINYTYVTDPTLDRDYILCFDDIDRIKEMNFIRFGIRNRLQTRSGGFRNPSIREWFSMENYWDVHFNEDDNYNHIGDFCTKFSFRPMKELSFNGFMSIDAGNNQEHEAEAVRGNRKAGRPGISGTFFNRLYLSMNYSPIEDINFTLSYNYKDGYIGRAAYSMGSTLTEIDSGSVFDQYYLDGREQTVTFGVSAPLTPDRRTFGTYSISYDIEDGGFTNQTFTVSRLFHCVLVSAMFEFERERDEGEIEYESSFSVTATLVGLEQPVDSVRRSAVSKFTGQ